MSETDRLLDSQGGAAPNKRPRSSAWCCCRTGPLSYSDVSEAADEVVEALVTDLSVLPTAWRDDARDVRVMDALHRVWTAVASEAPDSLQLAPPKIPSKEWKKLGFQGEDPYTDMRGTGLAGFIYVARVAEEYAEARMIGAAGDREMPFGIGALNVLWMLRCHLMLFRDVPSFCPCCGAGIRDEYTTKQPHGGRHIRGFAMLLLDEPDAFFHIFALTLLVTAAIWRRRGDASLAGSRGSRAASVSGGRARTSGSVSGSLISQPPSAPPLGHWAADDAAASAALGGEEGLGGASAPGGDEHLPPSSLAVVPASLPGAGGGLAGPRREARASSSQSASLGTVSILGSGGGGSVRSGSIAHTAFVSTAGASTISGGASVGGSSSSAAGDLRLLQFKSIVSEARELVLEAMATFPPDLTTLRATLFKRLRARPAGAAPHGPPAAGVGARGYGKSPAAAVADNGGGDFSYEAPPPRRGAAPQRSTLKQQPAPAYRSAPVPMPAAATACSRPIASPQLQHLPVHGSVGVGMTALATAGLRSQGQSQSQGPQHFQAGGSAYMSSVSNSSLRYGGPAAAGQQQWGSGGASGGPRAGDVTDEIVLNQDDDAVEV